MPLMTPDPTFYPSPTHGHASATGNARVCRADQSRGRMDAPTRLASWTSIPIRRATAASSARPTCLTRGDELHHFGWNACSSCLCPYAPHPHMERRYLVVPGINSSRIHILDTKPDPRQPRIVKVIEPETLAQRTGYAAPHTVHCGPDGIFMSALGAPDGNGPGGTFILDPETFDVRGRWETRSRTAATRVRHLVAPGARHDGHQHVGHAQHGEGRREPRAAARRESTDSTLHVWDLRRRRHVQELDLGDEQQMVLELRPAHNPTRAYGFAGVVVSLKDLSSSIWLWYRDASRKARTDRRSVGDQEGDRDPGRARRPGKAAAASAGIQGRRAARDRHQSLG